MRSLSSRRFGASLYFRSRRARVREKFDTSPALHANNTAPRDLPPAAGEKARRHKGPTFHGIPHSERTEEFDLQLGRER